MSGTWDARIATAIARAKAEIAADEAAGRLPRGIRDFATLHDHVDANEYGGLCDEDADGQSLWIEHDDTGDMTDACMTASTRVQDAIHHWLHTRGD